MSSLATATLILMAIWLGILTLVLILAIRQIGILTVRLSMAGETFSVDKDGPEIGSKIPTEVIEIVPDIEMMQANFVLLSSTCNPCRELVANLDGHRFNAKIIVLLAGRKELADGLASMLPSDLEVLRDPEASQIAAAFNIQSTPFAVAVSNGEVAQKAYLYSKDDLIVLVDGHKTTRTHSGKE